MEGELNEGDPPCRCSYLGGLGIIFIITISTIIIFIIIHLVVILNFRLVCIYILLIHRTSLIFMMMLFAPMSE
jgi:hypothetical protein